jgi:hypothetical protein
MFFVSVLRNALCILVPLSFLFSSYLYLYPAFHLCAFPAPEDNAHSAFLNTLRQRTFSSHNASKIAPFRLLALGDPQLEGDSSIPDAEAATFPNFSKFWRDALLLNGTEHNPLQRLRHSLHDLIDFYLDDIPKTLEVYRKRLDHIGNDYYLGHIYRTLHWWTDPTHVTVLGDLVGSQWIDDAEFEHRGWRYWNRVFRGGIRVSEEVASQPAEDFQDTIILGEDAPAWKKRIINVAGNHDIGYAGDLSPERMARFTRVFGKANYELRFQLPVNSTTVANSEEKVVEAKAEGQTEGQAEGQAEGEAEAEAGEQEDKPIPELRIILLNDMNLDTPAGSKELQDETYDFLNQVITTSHDVTRPAHFTLVLTHIPMYKQSGICIDGPFFDFFDGEFENGVKEQNHLSADASKGFLEGIFGMSGDAWVPGYGFGRNGLVLNGHDHEGCDVYHFINQSEPPERYWKAARWADAEAGGYVDEVGVVGLREVTVRSMMGAFGGNAGLLSLWFDEETWDWRFEFVNCKLGTQHIWWVVHVLDLITLGVGIVYGGFVLVEKFLDGKKGRTQKRMGNGHAKGPGKKENGTMNIPEINGNIDSPGAGKKSLRKKKSRAAITGGSPSPNGSTALNS